MMQLESSHIYLRDLRFHAYHGVLPQERVIGNEYVVNVQIDYSVARAMLSDDVEEMALPSRLLERVGYRICERLTAAYPAISAIELDIRKLNPPMGTDSKGAGVHFRFINKE